VCVCVCVCVCVYWKEGGVNCLVFGCFPVGFC